MVSSKSGLCIVVNKHVINYIEVYLYCKKVLTSYITNLNVRWIVIFYKLDVVPGKCTHPMLRIVGALKMQYNTMIGKYKQLQY